MDMVIETSRIPEQGETIIGEKASFFPGGKGANQAVAAARLGAKTTMIGAVGKDVFGKQLVQNLLNEQINKDALVLLDNSTTGMATILLTEGDNRIVVVPGANGKLEREHLLSAATYFEQCDLVMLQLEIPLDIVCAAVEIAKSYGKQVMLNPAPAAELPDSLLRQVDWITPNETELLQLAGLPANGASLESAMEALLAKGPSHVVTTLGKDGVRYKGRDGQQLSLPAHEVEVVDTTGAGDAFNAGLACGIIQYKVVDKALAFANAVGALAVTKMGAQSGMPRLKEVGKMLETQHS